MTRTHQTMTVGERISLIRNAETTYETLETLALDSDETVRRALADSLGLLLLTHLQRATLKAFIETMGLRYVDYDYIAEALAQINQDLEPGRNYPRWTEMTPKEFAELYETDEDAYWVVYALGWYDSDFHAFREKSYRYSEKHTRSTSHS